MQPSWMEGVETFHACADLACPKLINMVVQITGTISEVYADPLYTNPLRQCFRSILLMNSLDMQGALSLTIGTFGSCSLRLKTSEKISDGLSR